MRHQIAEYRGAGMDAHVAKPIELSVLARAIETALATSQTTPRAPLRQAVSAPR